MAKNECYAPLLSAGVKIDLVFAYGNRNDDGELTGPALSKNGVTALGICRVVNLKDRAKGLGDAEIAIDGDWWEKASDEEKDAVIDHELYHIKLTGKTDDLGRPKIKMRKHDFDFGWFTVIALRHGIHSVEVKQAKAVMDNVGQFYWPGIAPTVTIESGGESVTMAQGRFARISNELAAQKGTQ